MPSDTTPKSTEIPPTKTEQEWIDYCHSKSDPYDDAYGDQEDYE